MQGTLQPCAEPQATTQIHRDWADTLFSLSLNPRVTFFRVWRAHTSQQYQTHGCLRGTGRLLAGGRAQQDSPQSQGMPRDDEEDIPAAGTAGTMRAPGPRHITSGWAAPWEPNTTAICRGRFNTAIPVWGPTATPASSQPWGPTASGTRGSAENVMPEKINKAANEVICIAISRQDLQWL